MTVADVMRTDFRSCNASTAVAEVVAAMRQSLCSFLPVTRAQIPIGIVTEHGLANALADRGGDLSRLTAGELMSDGPPTVLMTAPIAEAVDRLAEAGGHLLAVDADGLLKGVVTTAELGPQLTDAGLGRLVAHGAPEAGLPAAGAAPAVAGRGGPRGGPDGGDQILEIAGPAAPLGLSDRCAPRAGPAGLAVGPRQSRRSRSPTR